MHYVMLNSFVQGYYSIFKFIESQFVYLVLMKCVVVFFSVKYTKKIQKKHIKMI